MEIFGYRIPSAVSLLLWCGIWEIVGRYELVFIFRPSPEYLSSFGTLWVKVHFTEQPLAH